VDDPAEVMISALEHFSFCPRQCGLIHVEQTFDENVYTIRGRLAHEAVDAGETTEGPDARVLRGVPLWSERLGLRGRADVVELRRDGPYPVEYKVGPPHGPHASIQLCAQALCLEDMFGRPVARGALFHHATRRRVEVTFTAALRARTREVIDGVREILATSIVPPAPNDARCRHCSLIDSCMPSVTCADADVGGWDRELMTADGAGGP
jgi:CRISPR-associated exonuclease Cas4